MLELRELSLLRAGVEGTEERDRGWRRRVLPPARVELVEDWREGPRLSPELGNPT